MKDISDLLKKHPEWANWTYDDLVAEGCRIEAEIEDQEARRTKIYRENGFVALHDAKLFSEVCRRLGMGSDTKLDTVIQFLRMKKRRGHKQQELIEVWDRYYTGGAVFADEPTVDRLEEIFWSREDGRNRRAAGN